jgi:hypothetical protein
LMHIYDGNFAQYIFVCSFSICTDLFLFCVFFSFFFFSTGPWSLGPYHFGPKARLNIMAGSRWKSKAPHFMAAKQWEEEVLRSYYSLQEQANDLLILTRPHLLKVPPPLNSTIS